MSTIPRGTAAYVGRKLRPEPSRPLPTDPVRWVRDELDEHLWSHQRRFMRAVVQHRHVAWKACHGPGKSYCAGRLAAWWIAAHPPGEAFVVTTAPSGPQVRAILWREIRRAQRKAGLAGSITRGQIPEWWIGSELVAFGRKPRDFASPDEARAAFQGIHARYVLVLLDEACGVPQWLWEATEALVTNEASRIVAIGNPDDPTTQFAKVCAPGSGWHVLTTAAKDTPNFTGEQVPEQLREELVSRIWVEEREREWGRESPLFISKVEGEFPDVSDEAIITPKMVREAHERDLSGNAIGTIGQGGMDVARFGKDETCIYRNQDGYIREMQSWHKLDTDESRSRTQAILDEEGMLAFPLLIDVVGLGAGVYDPLRKRGYNVAPFNGGEAALQPDRFVNRSAEVWWAFREGLEAGLYDLDPEDLKLAAQLQSRRWREDPSGKRIEIEKKDKMAQRGIQSPDHADAAILASIQPTAIPDPKVLSADPTARRDPLELEPVNDLLDRPT